MLHKKQNKSTLESVIATSELLDTMRIKHAIDQVEVALREFGLVSLLKHTEVVVLGQNLVHKQRITNRFRLMIFGFIDDLTDFALIGLVVHLFGLIVKDFDKNYPVKGEDKLKNDLVADELAKKWGFREEMNAFRKARPYRAPEDFKYPLGVLDCSKYNKKFSDLFNNILTDKKILRHSHKARIIYTERFSLVCDLGALSDQTVESLIIINNFNNMTEDRLKNILQEIF